MLSSFSLPSSTAKTDLTFSSRISSDPSLRGLAEEAAAAAAAEARVAESAEWPLVEGDDEPSAPAWGSAPSTASLPGVVGGKGG